MSSSTNTLQRSTVSYFGSQEQNARKAGLNSAGSKVEQFTSERRRECQLWPSVPRQTWSGFSVQLSLLSKRSLIPYLLNLAKPLNKYKLNFKLYIFLIMFILYFVNYVIMCLQSKYRYLTNTTLSHKPNLLHRQTNIIIFNKSFHLHKERNNTLYIERPHLKYVLNRIPYTYVCWYKIFKQSLEIPHLSIYTRQFHNNFWSPYRKTKSVRYFYPYYKKCSPVYNMLSTLSSPCVTIDYASAIVNKVNSVYYVWSTHRNWRYTFYSMSRYR